MSVGLHPRLIPFHKYISFANHCVTGREEILIRVRKNPALYALKRIRLLLSKIPVYISLLEVHLRANLLDLLNSNCFKRRFESVKSI